jgi:hypothetical protein
MDIAPDCFPCVGGTLSSRMQPLKHVGRVSHIGCLIALYVAVQAVPELSYRSLDRVERLIDGSLFPRYYYSYTWGIAIDVGAASAIGIFLFCLMLPLFRAARHLLALNAATFLGAGLVLQASKAWAEWGIIRLRIPKWLRVP